MANTLGRRASRTWRRAITSTLAIAVLTGLTGCPDDSIFTALLDDNGTAPETYTVNYDANNATSGTAPSDQTKDHGVDLALSTNSGNLERTGDSFVGWNTAADGSGIDYAEGATYTDDADVTLYAKWTPNYEVGDTGPAAGIVFYDKGEYTDDWRYLEAAPESTEWVAEWGDYGTLIGGDAQLTDIGDGQAATDAVVAHMQDKSITGTAAQLCAGLSHSEYSDWFLPSRDELNQMYLQRGAIGGFASAYYWSSSEVNVEGARGQHFDHGGLPDFYKYLEYRVRGARAF